MHQEAEEKEEATSQLVACVTSVVYELYKNIPAVCWCKPQAGL